ncbi:hypothetical protein [Thioalkalivibrio paradoxus]|uniref:Uncharacterized protein n=1 Tax=Thioalkalivibrio paradoxus ARh 1 TaxID=713585 RepID=W0DN46_9GAMM|nr:hypothetical protein [Thioalkalivibrio paradoxus]AHF00020.1 hypothetical protein THITH_06640 [Thioalkalivibrio paradoxus ARh 1]
MKHKGNIRQWAALLLVVPLLSATVVLGQELAPQARHAEMLERIERSPLPGSIKLVSTEGNREILGQVHALVPHGLEQVSGALGSAASWCEITFLHPNVKACTHDEGVDDTSTLQLYLGRRFFEPPDEATALQLRFEAIRVDDDHFEVSVGGARGPHGTRNFRMQLEAFPLHADETLVQLRYSVEIGALARFALRVYFATGGRHRIGFSLDDDGEPVRGLRGMIERNVMRFHLGLKAYLETRDEPQVRRLQARLERWFELSERYPEQLRELDRDRYLDQKQREWRQQQRL